MPAEAQTADRGAAAVAALIDALGIDSESYNRYVAWCLAEQLVTVLTQAVADNPDHQSTPLWKRPDGGKRFRRILRDRTGRRLE